jgi:hypothetical protein
MAGIQRSNIQGASGKMGRTLRKLACELTDLVTRMAAATCGAIATAATHCTKLFTSFLYSLPQPDVVNNTSIMVTGLCCFCI